MSLEKGNKGELCATEGLDHSYIGNREVNRPGPDKFS